MIEIPSRMTHLAVDPRGYPIPAIVLRTSDGRAHFTINDDRKVLRAAREKLCGICGKRLRKDEYWFVGGPASAFHPRGAYLDGPTHRECATFAVQVCPYIAAPRYARRIDERTLTTENREEIGILVDNTVIPDRPTVFVLGRATDYSFVRAENATVRFHPRKPFVEWSFWQHGTQLSDEQAAPAVAKALSMLA